MANDNKGNTTTVFNDQSKQSHTAAASGNAQYSTGRAPTGLSSSVLFDGSGDVLSVSSANAWDSLVNNGGNTPKTIEVWAYAVNLTSGAPFAYTEPTLLGKGDLYSSLMWVPDGTVRFYWYDGSAHYVNTATGVVATGAWYHTALDFDGAGNVTIYVNGVQKATGVFTGLSAGALGTTERIGANQQSAPRGDWDGNIAAVRFTNARRYTANFTPPTLPLPVGGSDPIVATGGTITTVGNYRVHTFTSSGTFRVTKGNGALWYLVVGGGGEGGVRIGGGGGGGGFRTNGTYNYSVSPGNYTVTIGAGGSGVVDHGANGATSTFATIDSTGGGGGGGYSTGNNGNAGGSGGGGGTDGTDAGGAASPVGQGNAGGSGINSSGWHGGGGGGAGAVGANGVSGVSGNGGAGIASSISGASVYYAGGGGGSADTTGTAGNGGAGGGAAGGISRGATGGSGIEAGAAGTVNTGGGGGAGGYPTGGSGNGGSGIVIVRYAIGTAKVSSPVPSTIVATGGTMTDTTESGVNYRVHTFTASSTGTFRVLSGSGSVWYLVVAGGGSAGGRTGAGGGAGGYRTNGAFDYPVKAGSYAITVGAGGVGVAAGVSTAGNDGGNSTFDTITSTGGGGGGTSVPNNTAGLSGGSGGGGGGSVSSGGSASPSGQGNAGGDASGGAPNYGSGGGGGAGAVGGAGTATSGGNGGIGLQNSISGTAVYYAGGGGGGTYTGGTIGLGGTGGGGNSGLPPVSGTNGTGGGGGGGLDHTSSYVSGAGGSGVVIIKYPLTITNPNYSVPSPITATGGIITQVGNRRIHTFQSGGTFTVTSGKGKVWYLVVAGGGGGGNTRGGGGGAGGFRTNGGYTYAVTPGSYTVTVGAGGTGSTGDYPTYNAGTSGSNSVFDTITSTGGGLAGSRQSPNSGKGVDGGSGGGSSYTATTAGAGTAGQGNAGGADQDGVDETPGSGGGGAGAVGQNAISSGPGSVAGNGGTGTASSITGASVTYAGGGGGGERATSGGGGAGGNGGGGSGADHDTSTAATAGTANTGGGGGGGSYSNVQDGKNGGSGVVIISYLTSQNLVNPSQNNRFTNGLVGLWSFDGPDMSGTTAYDRSGNGDNAILTNGPLRVIGKIGQALSFDGVNDYASTTITNPTGATPTTETFSTWINPAAFSNNIIFEGATTFNSGTPNRYLQLQANGTIRVLPCNVSYSAATATTLTANRWYHVAWVRDGTSNKIYINGVQEVDSAITATCATASIHIGTGGAANSFGGKIDDFRIYNRALSATEVKQLYLQGK